MPGLSNSVLTVFGVVVTCLLAASFRVSWRLKHIRGPFYARFTNLQRVWWVKTGCAHEIHQRVHRQYGDVARFGPNMVSVADPAAIPTVYPTRPGFPKVRPTNMSESAQKMQSHN
jgi:hypothetical protein